MTRSTSHNDITFTISLIDENEFTIWGDEESAECGVCGKTLIVDSLFTYSTGYYHPDLQNYICNDNILDGCQYVFKQMTEFMKCMEREYISRQELCNLTIWDKVFKRRRTTWCYGNAKTTMVWYPHQDSQDSQDSKVTK